MVRTVKGVIKVDQFRGDMQIVLPSDFGAYYSWFILKKYWIYINRPLHGIHVTLTNKKLLFNQKQMDWVKAKKYHNQDILVEYDVDVKIGGSTKDFKNFYVKVVDGKIQTIKDDVNIIESEKYKGMHITLGSTKGGVRNFFDIKN